MNKVTREQFLALPAGVIYIELGKYDIGPAIKGPTTDDGLRFQKRVVRPTAEGKVALVETVQAGQDQVEFDVLDDVEMMACKALIFDELEGLTPDEYIGKVERLIETFAKMASIRIRLPDGSTIRGDGKEFEPTAQGSDSVN